MWGPVQLHGLHWPRANSARWKPFVANNEWVLATHVGITLRNTWNGTKHLSLLLIGQPGPQRHVPTVGYDGCPATINDGHFARDNSNQKVLENKDGGTDGLLSPPFGSLPSQFFFYFAAKLPTSVSLYGLHTIYSFHICRLLKWRFLSPPPPIIPFYQVQVYRELASLFSAV